MDTKKDDINLEEKNIGDNSKINVDSNLNSEDIKKKQNKQIIWAIVLMVTMILIILSVPIFINNYINKFDYNGLEFTKTKFGEIVIYSSNIPILNTTSSSLTGKDILDEYSFYLRNDPRELDNVNVALDINNITFYKSRPVYVSYNVSDPRCEYNTVAASELARFLINFGNLNVKGAFINEDYAVKSKVPYVTCENQPHNTVILVTNGNENKISLINDHCYELQYRDCDILPVTEKYILSVAEGYLNNVYSGKKA